MWSCCEMKVALTRRKDSPGAGMREGEGRCRWQG